MPRVKLPDNKKRSHIVKLSLNDLEYKKFQMLKNRLSKSSPTLSGNEFLRQCILKHDGNDFALLKYFEIELLNPFQSKLCLIKNKFVKKILYKKD